MAKKDEKVLIQEKNWEAIDQGHSGSIHEMTSAMQVDSDAGSNRGGVIVRQTTVVDGSVSTALLYVDRVAVVDGDLVAR